MKVAPWVKWYAGDFLQGVAELGPHEGWVYTVVLNLIYDRGEPIPDDMGRLARRCNMRPTSVAKAIENLIEAGKLTRSGGLLANDRAEREMKSARSRRKVGKEYFTAVAESPGKGQRKQRRCDTDVIRNQYGRDTYQKPEAR